MFFSIIFAYPQKITTVTKAMFKKMVPYCLISMSSMRIRLISWCSMTLQHDQSATVFKRYSTAVCYCNIFSDVYLLFKLHHFFFFLFFCIFIQAKFIGSIDGSFPLYSLWTLQTCWVNPKTHPPLQHSSSLPI